MTLTKHQVCAARGGGFVAAYVKSTGSDSAPATALVDLTTDLLHYAEMLDGTSPESVIGSARMHVEAEVAQHHHGVPAGDTVA